MTNLLLSLLLNLTPQHNNLWALQTFYSPLLSSAMFLLPFPQHDSNVNYSCFRLMLFFRCKHEKPPAAAAAKPNKSTQQPLDYLTLKTMSLCALQTFCSLQAHRVSLCAVANTRGLCLTFHPPWSKRPTYARQSSPTNLESVCFDHGRAHQGGPDLRTARRAIIYAQRNQTPPTPHSKFSIVAPLVHTSRRLYVSA